MESRPGAAVARLVPVIPDAWVAMVASGTVTLAADPSDLADEAPGDYDVDASAVLAQIRAGER